MPNQSSNSASSTPASRSLWIALGGLGFAVTGFIAFVLLDAGPEIEAVLQREDSPVAWLTSALFCMAAAVALIPVARGNRPGLHALVGLWCALAAVDEWFMVHETLKGLILFDGYAGDLKAMGVSGDLPLLAFAMLGCGCYLLLFKRTARTTPRMLWLVGLGLGGLAIVFDVFFPVETWQAVEEIVEAYAAAALLAGGVAESS